MPKAAGDYSATPHSVGDCVTGESETFKTCGALEPNCIARHVRPRAMRETGQQHSAASRISIYRYVVTPSQPPRHAAQRQQPAQTSRQGIAQPGQAVLPISARGAERSLACSYNSQVSKVLLHTSTPDDVVSVDSPVIWSLAAPVLLLFPEPLPWPSWRCCCHRCLAWAARYVLEGGKRGSGGTIAPPLTRQ